MVFSIQCELFPHARSATSTKVTADSITGSGRREDQTKRRSPSSPSPFPFPPSKPPNPLHNAPPPRPPPLLFPHLVPSHLTAKKVHRLIAPRDQKYQSNFVEFRQNKIVYRRYAGLFFCACVDANDNELAYLEAIHFFVEVLDSFFGNVCELDLVFNFYKVCRSYWRERGKERLGWAGLGWG